LLFDRYLAPLCAFSHVYTRNRDAAEEIVQELFIWLWTHRSALETPASVAGYLHTAVRHRSYNRVRDDATELRIYQSAADAVRDELPRAALDAPDALAEARDLADALERAVAAMPLRCREVFTLSRAQHLTYGEIAEVLHLSPKTVEIHMSRALAQLRERLAPWLPE
jgi:RNA polymerase sigma-70 factor (ECF subfamily)